MEALKMVGTDRSGDQRAVNGARLAVTKDSVNLNVTTKTALLTVPPDYAFIPTMMVVRNASTSLTTAVFGFGFNANADDVDGSSAHTSLVDDTVCDIIIPLTGVVVGQAGDILGIKCSVAQGAAATASVDVFGYYIPA